MTDKQIIQRLQSRDETGLAALQQAYGEGALSLALRITGSREDAQECLQDALMGVWESVPPQCPASLRAYLIALTRNAALDLLRSERREKRGGGAAERRQNVKGTFAVTRSGARALAAAGKEKAVLVVDDIMTTGSTLSECARTLKAAGAGKVWCVTLARSVRS